MKGIISFAVNALDQKSASSYRQKVIRIVDAQKEVCLLLIGIIAVVYCIVYYSNIPSIWYS